MTIQADEEDLKIEAERTRYRLQTSNKPLSINIVRSQQLKYLNRAFNVKYSSLTLAQKALTSRNKRHC